MNRISLLCILTILFLFSLRLSANADNWASFKITNPHLKKISSYKINKDKIVELSSPNQYTVVLKGTMKKPRGEYIKNIKAYVKYDVNKFVIDCDKKRLNVVKTMLIDYKGNPIKTLNLIDDVENWNPTNKDIIKPGIGQDVYNYICK